MEEDKISQRFRVATEALKALNEWLDQGGANPPPPCVVERMEHHAMSSEQYYEFWKSFAFLDPRSNDEQHAIEDSAIRKVQPGWQRRPLR